MDFAGLETELDTCKYLQIRSAFTQALRDHYAARGYSQVTPPKMIQSQVYLETVIPALGDIYRISHSYLAERGRTRRHLATYAHVQVECPFIAYGDLLERLEDLVVDVCKRVIKSKSGRLITELKRGLSRLKNPSCGSTIPMPSFT